MAEDAKIQVTSVKTFRCSGWQNNYFEKVTNKVAFNGLDHYPNASISYMSLGNIHDISSSHKALLKAVSTQADSPNWYSMIESTGWLTHVAGVLKSAAGRDGVVGKMLEESSSVLVVSDSRCYFV